MPTRNSVKKIITPYELQGSEGDEAYLIFKPPTLDEAQELRIISQDIESKINQAISDYADKISKPVSEFTDGDKQNAYDNAGLSDDIINKTKRLISDFIVEWNWVDDNSEPLPQPKDDYTVLGRLYSPEYNYVMSLIKGDENPKN